MKKTAVIIYPGFCNFEICVALETLALYGKPVTIFASKAAPVCGEDGLTVLPDKCLEDLIMDEYDSLLLPGAEDIGDAVSDEKLLSVIREFHNQKKIIGAISAAPILLVKCGVMGTKPFMAGMNPEDLYEEGFTEQELHNMQGWDANLKNPVTDGYIISENIITSVSYEFVRFGLAFAKMLGIEISPKTFGIAGICPKDTI